MSLKQGVSALQTMREAVISSLHRLISTSFVRFSIQLVNISSRAFCLRKLELFKGPYLASLAYPLYVCTFNSKTKGVPSRERALTPLGIFRDMLFFEESTFMKERNKINILDFRNINKLA